MKAIKFKHKGEDRIKLVFPYNSEIIKLIKQIKGCRWSQTNQFWHTPDTKEAFDNLKKLIPNVESDNIEIKKNKELKNEPSALTKKVERKTEPVVAPAVHPRRVYGSVCTLVYNPPKAKPIVSKSSCKCCSIVFQNHTRL